jgi:hypothetical protein
MAARTKTTMGKFSNPFWDNTYPRKVNKEWIEN